MGLINLPVCSASDSASELAIKGIVSRDVLCIGENEFWSERFRNLSWFIQGSQPIMGAE